MAKAKSVPPPAPDEIAELRQEIASLKDHIRLLVDAIDEVREELGWLTRNGLPLRDPLPPIPVLKQMALDPCAEDWGERLVIERGEPKRPVAEPKTTPVIPQPPNPNPPSPPGRPGFLF